MKFGKEKVKTSEMLAPPSKYMTVKIYSPYKVEFSSYSIRRLNSSLGRYTDINVAMARHPDADGVEVEELVKVGPGMYIKPTAIIEVVE